MSLTLRDLERAVRRGPSPYTSTHPLEDLDVELADGTSLALVLKSDAIDEHARGAKPAFLVDPGRERLAYESLLPVVGDAAPTLYSALDGALLLERVEGVPLTEVGDPRMWYAAMRRVGGIHARLAGAPQLGLPRYERLYYERWLERAQAFQEGGLGWIEAPHARAVDRLLALPQSVIHGELYASNVVVGGDRICVLDWETVSVGPAVVDVAALSAGSWAEAERERLARSYLEARSDLDRSADEFLDDLACARLHLAVQWLGWSGTWTPPLERRHDWLEEARTVAARLGVA